MSGPGGVCAVKVGAKVKTTGTLAPKSKKAARAHFE